MEITMPAPVPTFHARIVAWLHAGRLLPWLVLAASLLATQQLWRDARQAAMQELKTDFDYRVREAGARIKQRMAAHEQALRGVYGLFGASIKVDRSEFRAYIGHLHLAGNHAGIDGVGFSQIVPAAEKDKHVAAIRNEGFSGYSIEPEGERGTYAPAVYIEPFAGRNLRIFGSDLYVRPEHRVAMELARDSDKAAITGKVASGSEVSAGIVMYMPIYRNGAPHTSRANRRANIAGWIFAPFSMPSLMSGLFRDQARDLDIEIYDGAKTTNEALLFDGDAISIHNRPGVLFKTTLSLDIAGHNWTMLVGSHPAFEARLNHDKPQLIAGIGVCASLLLALLTWLLVRNWSRAMQVNQGLEWELAARKKLQAMLHENEERWRLALEGSGEGVCDWNIQTGETAYSRRWKEVLGFYEDKLWDGQDEWMKRIHPEDRPAAIADLQAHFDGKTAAADCEFRMMCKGGRWKWVHCRGMVVSRDIDGKPLRFVGTIADITERREREYALRLVHCAQYC